MRESELYAELLVILGYHGLGVLHVDVYQHLRHDRVVLDQAGP